MRIQKGTPGGVYVALACDWCGTLSKYKNTTDLDLENGWYRSSFPGWTTYLENNVQRDRCPRCSKQRNIEVVPQDLDVYKVVGKDAYAFLKIDGLIVGQGTFPQCEKLARELFRSVRKTELVYKLQNSMEGESDGQGQTGSS